MTMDYMYSLSLEKRYWNVFPSPETNISQKVINTVGVIFFISYILQVMHKTYKSNIHGEDKKYKIPRSLQLKDNAITLVYPVHAFFICLFSIKKIYHATCFQMVALNPSTSSYFFPNLWNVSKGYFFLNNRSIKIMGEEMATYSSILAGKIPWTERPPRQQSKGLQRVGHYWANEYAHLDQEQERVQ